MKGGKKRSSSQPSYGTDTVAPPPQPPPPPPQYLAEATTSDTVSAGQTAAEEPDHHHLKQQSVAAAAEKEKDGERNRDDGDHEEEEEAEDEEGNHEEQLGAGEGGEEAEGDGERPKLAEGYYEIEAVRKKRVRKGQVQYLIKWRGWPETANTWEPLENLVSISDVIDAFEESLRTGKHRSTRRRKRKHGSTQSQPKKKQQQQQQRSPAATYDVPAVQVRLIEETLPLPSINDLNCTDHVNSNSGRMNGVETAPKENENGLRSSFLHIVDRKEQNELDLTLNELREAMATNGDNMDKDSVDHLETQMTRADGLANGLLKVDVEPVQSGRGSGAKRRKSGSVKRFRQDSTSSVNGDAQALTITNFSDAYAADGQLGNDVACTSNLSESICMITEIIKPISYSSSMSNNVQDVSITFVGKRSDGKEVMVDNKYLKANNPLLLINFYEQHLRYNPT